MTEAGARLKIKEFNSGYEGAVFSEVPDRLFISRLREEFSNIQIAKILTILDETCNECWNSDTPCHCTNDE